MTNIALPKFHFEKNKDLKIVLPQAFFNHSDIREIASQFPIATPFDLAIGLFIDNKLNQFEALPSRIVQDELRSHIKNVTPAKLRKQLQAIRDNVEFLNRHTFVIPAKVLTPEIEPLFYRLGQQPDPPDPDFGREISFIEPRATTVATSEGLSTTKHISMVLAILSGGFVISKIIKD